MKKKIFAFIVCAILCLTLLPCSAFASGEVIGDGGGGQMGGGTYENGWQSGTGGKAAEAVRVSVINLDTKQTVGNVVDFTNVKFNGDMYVTTTVKNFTSIKNKLYYLNGGSFSWSTSPNYDFHNPTIQMPRVILDGTGLADPDVLKTYFATRDVLNEVAEQCGVEYDLLVSGKYAILLEPVAYFNFQGIGYALSATEVAMYNQLLTANGMTTVYSKLRSVSHNTLPLSMFLDTTKTIYTGTNTYEVVSRLGLKVWTGSTNAAVSDADIKTSLGNMLVVFPQSGGGDTGDDDGGDDSPPAITGIDYVYNTDSDVISSVYVTASSEINSSNPLTVNFTIKDSSGSVIKRIAVPSIVIPKNEQQIVWCKWKTPTTPQNVTIEASLSQPSKSSLSKTTLIAQIVDPQEILPPDPEATDLKPGGWSVPSSYYSSSGSTTKHEWSVWACTSRQVTGYPPTYPPSVKYVDGSEAKYHIGSCLVCNGSSSFPVVHKQQYLEYQTITVYDFYTIPSSMTVSADITLEADDINRCPTQYTQMHNGSLKYYIKAGYGVRTFLDTTVNLYGSCTSNDYGMTVCADTTFPEFNYSTYNRLLESNGASGMYFKPNLYSHWYNRVHFTPVWYPDGEYRVKCEISSIWTPVGELKLTLSDYVMINGTVFDDWYVGLKD